MNPDKAYRFALSQASTEDKERHQKAVDLLLLLFCDFILSLEDEDLAWQTLEELMATRADIGIQRAFNGFGIDYDEAIKLIQTADNLTDLQKNQREIILAAIDNIVDFSVAEEYQMIEELAEIEDAEDLDWECEDIDSLEWMFAVFYKYNDRYAYTENLDIEYAMSVAAYLSAISNETVLTYMTQGDERVRPWHLQYEGYSAPRSLFPDWLIPPIEHQCRCYLVEDTMSVMASIKASASELKMPKWFNKTFKESVANGGRIFSDEHPYFQVDTQHVDKLRAIALRIKSKYFSDSNE